ncbi:MAG: glycoside hydrolase family 3 protein [Chlamydiota bacterium]
MLKAILPLYLSPILCLTSPLEEMTLEEKVGQLFIVCFKGEEANEDAKILVQEIRVGGIIYYDWANGLHSPEQVLSLSLGLQKLTLVNPNPIPLLLAADQEGGLVARLRKGFSAFPGNKALGMTSDPSLSKESAFAIGQELQAVGINFNLSPVVDINSNPRNPIIGIRSFGDSADVVTSFAKEALKGYHDAGIITSLKHFPGHGDVEIDSHKALPVLYKSKETLEEVELLPFKELAPMADTIMTAHLMVPSIDPIHCATLSKPILDILRKEIGFKGVIIADSLTMEGVLKNSPSIEEAAISALNAGCDLLLLGGKQLIGTTINTETSIDNIKKIHQAVIKAIKEGIVSEERVNEAVQRILLLKEKIRPLNAKTEEQLKELIKIPAYQALSEKISTLAIKTIKNKPIPLLKEQKIAILAPTILEDALKETPLLHLGKKTESLFFTGLNPTDLESKAACEIANQADLIIFCSYNAWKNPAQESLLASLSLLKKPFIFLIVRDPLDESLHSTADLIIKTYSPAVSSIKAACEELK